MANPIASSGIYGTFPPLAYNYYVPPYPNLTQDTKNKRDSTQFLMNSNVHVGPITRWNFTDGVGMDANHVRLAQAAVRSLIQREPCHFIDQLLLCLVIGSRTSIRVVDDDISSVHSLLVSLLRGCIRAEVVAIVELIVGLSVTELERQPVLRIGIVSAPTG